MIDKVLNKLSIEGAIKIYPYDIKIEEMGFYTVLSRTSRVKNDIYQITLFLNENPYMHKLIGRKELEYELEFNTDLYKDSFKSNLSDKLVFNLAEVKELPSEEENKRAEEIQLLISKYDEYLECIDEGKFNRIKNVFDFYIKSENEDIKRVELFLKQELHI